MLDVSLQSTGPMSPGGTMSEPSRPRAIGESMSSAEAFPVLTSATPDCMLGLRASKAAYGPNMHGSFAFFDLDTLSSKTWQLCLDGDLEEFSGTWPNAGTMRNGIFFPLQQSVPHISVTESSSWPTPTVNGNNNRKGCSPTSGDGLTTVVKRRRSLPDRQSLDSIGGGLNPDWVDWLIGFPIGHTACDVSATPSSRKSPSISADVSSPMPPAT